MQLFTFLSIKSNDFFEKVLQTCVYNYLAEIINTHDEFNNLMQQMMALIKNVLKLQFHLFEFGSNYFDSRLKQLKFIIQNL